MRLGGKVEVESSDSLGVSIGSDFATVLDRIVAIRLRGRKIDDRVLLMLGSYRRLLASLRTLELHDTSVTSVGLAELRDLDKLSHLDLSGTQVSQEAAAQLVKELSRLETLVLRDTGLGWSGAAGAKARRIDRVDVIPALAAPCVERTVGGGLHVTGRVGITYGTALGSLTASALDAQHSFAPPQPPCPPAKESAMPTIQCSNAAAVCDVLTRRSFLRVGAMTLGGLTLADVLRLRAATTVASPRRTSRSS